MILISVIIPVYNVERYLRRCVDSVLNQTYQNIEVILVDDGSPDGSPQICDEYAKRDSRVTVLHKENGGLSSARNAALDSPLKGDFVTFVDSDDWIAIDTYDYCINLIKNYEGTDVVQFEAMSVYNDKPILKKQQERINMYLGKDILQHYLYSTTKSTGYSVCRCLFSRKLIKKTRFREGKINEDIDWKFIILRRSTKMIDSSLIKYYYYQTGNSTSGAPLRMRDYQLREAGDILYELTKKESYGNIAFLGKVKKARTPLSLLCKIAYYGIGDPSIDKKQTIKELTLELRHNLPVLLKAPIPISRKVLSIMFSLNYYVTEKIVRFIK